MQQFWRNECEKKPPSHVEHVSNAGAPTSDSASPAVAGPERPIMPNMVATANNPTSLVDISASVPFTGS